MNKKRYWLRGGIIVGFLFPILIILLSGLFQTNTLSGLMLPIPGAESFIESDLVSLVCDYNNALCGLIFYFLFSFSLIFIFWFVIGALIGFIYGKIKNRKNSQLTPNS